MEAQQSEDWLPHVAKARSCPSLGPLRIGNFGLFPTATKEALPQMFSVPLLEAAPHLVDFLRLCASVPTTADLFLSCARYRTFLELQARHWPEPLLPPLDVALVHLSHMLQSDEYHDLARDTRPGLEWLPHCCMWALKSRDALDAALKRGTSAWKATRHRDSFVINGVAWQWPSDCPEGVPELPSEPKLECGVEADDPRVQMFGTR